MITDLFKDIGPPSKSDQHPYVLKEERSNLISSLETLLKDQIKYHKKISNPNETAHRNLKGFTWIIFVIVFIIVCLHFFIEKYWFLLITASFPAFVTAFHGILDQMEMKRTAENSKNMVEQLSPILETIESLDKSEDPILLRNLCRITCELLYKEHEGWVNIMENNKLEVEV